MLVMVWALRGSYATQRASKIFVRLSLIRDSQETPSFKGKGEGREGGREGKGEGGIMHAFSHTQHIHTISHS